MRCVYGANFYSTWFLKDNLREKLQDFSCFYERFSTWSISFNLSTFKCHLFILFNYYHISFHKDNLKMNKNGTHTTSERESKELSVVLEWIFYSKSWSK